MAENKKITDLNPSLPKDGYAFVAATEDDNFRVSYSDLAESSSIGTKSGAFLESLTISGETVLTGSAFDPRFNDLSGQLVSTGNLLQGGIINLSGALDASGNLLQGEVSNLSGSLDASGSLLQGEIELINTELDLASSSSFVFFSDFSNNNGATFKSYYSTPSPDIYLSGVVVDFATNMKATIRWDGPPDDYMGTGYINGVQIPTSNITELGDKTRRFEGYIDNLNLTDENVVSGSANGRTGYLNLFEIGIGIPAEDVSIAQINTATAAPGSDLGTTHLKNGDSIDIEVVYDTNKFGHPLQIPASINVYNESLAEQSNHTNLSWHVSPLGAGFSGVTLPVVVSNRDGDLGVCIDSTNYAGITAAKQCSTDFVAPNRSRPVDNITPVISFGLVDYPAGQKAIKDAESVTVNHTILNADSYSYSSNNGDLNIASATSYETAKIASRINGGYNVSSNNFNITATKTTNGLIVSSATNVKIANVPLQLTIPNLNGNIQSGPNPGAVYNFDLDSDQILNDIPSLSLDVAQNPISNLVHSSQGTGLTSNSFQLKVEDGDQKGLFNWSASAVNLAGILTVQVLPVSYNLAGFTERDLQSAPNSLGQGLAPIGSAVSDPNNIIFENVSKGGPGPNGGTFFSYKFYANGIQLDNSYDFVNEFAVCDSSGVTKSDGNYVFNLDKLNRAANAAAPGAKFIVEEN